MYPTYFDYYVGFCVVQVPEPGPIMMLALVAIDMLRKRGT